MEYKLDNLQPQNVFRFFEELTRIPHGSGDTKRISDYCVDFAKERNLKYIQDEYNNIIIFKPATAGYENASPVIIQGHLDMVNEKTSDSAHDFSKDPLNLIVEGDILRADNTTLGGDDGIAVAYALAILDSSSIEHPAIEAVFTVDEEIGMLGADKMDLSMLKGRYMLNIDSDDEGILLASCAGGITSLVELPVEYHSQTGLLVDITIDGLLGGHSGVEIDKHRANANCLLGRLLFNICDIMDVSVVSVTGGSKDNAIPRESSVKCVISPEDFDLLNDIAKSLNEDLKAEYGVTDSNINISVNKGTEGNYDVLTVNSMIKFIFLLCNLPNGIMSMSPDIDGLVETSLNLGILKMDEEKASFGFAVRSSIAASKRALKDKIRFMAEFVGADYSESGDYPEWAYKRDSKLRDIMTEVFKKQYGHAPEIQAIHAGLECGIIASKIKDVDIVSFGPEMKDIHTPNESLVISSVKRTWDFIIEVLKELK